jgi:ATP-dependent Clp endopeptidase proteolytic subunit ClpP
LKGFLGEEVREAAVFEAVRGDEGRLEVGIGGHFGACWRLASIEYMAASMASFILGAGERGKRVALPNSRVMIHQPMGGSEGQAEDIRVEAEQILKIKGTLVTMYAQMTGNSREQIMKDLDRDNYMSAQQALDYGLIDKIVTSVNGP